MATKVIQVYAYTATSSVHVGTWPHTSIGKEESLRAINEIQSSLTPAQRDLISVGITEQLYGEYLSSRTQIMAMLAATDAPTKQTKVEEFMGAYYEVTRQLNDFVYHCMRLGDDSMVVGQKYFLHSTIIPAEEDYIDYKGFVIYQILE